LRYNSDEQERKEKKDDKKEMRIYKTEKSKAMRNVTVLWDKLALLPRFCCYHQNIENNG